MYKPNYTITNKIVNNIAEIAAAREIILGAYLVPSYDLLLKTNAITKLAHSSTSIEGNPLSFKQVNDLHKGKDVKATNKAKKEVMNYINVLENIDKYHKKYKINEKKILRMHKDITNGTLKRPDCEGKYRNNGVLLGNIKMGIVNYVPPDHYKVPELMKNFFEWINSAEDIHPVLLAGISHYEFVRIHPFIDGNGRTARALATLILYIKEFDIKRYFALDEFYDLDRDSYESALRSADRTQDLTKWLEYFTDGVLISILKVKQEVIDLSSERHKVESKGQVALSDKERKIILYLQENEKIANKDVQEMFEITSQAAVDIFKKLMKRQVIERKGAGPKTHYVLKMN